MSDEGDTPDDPNQDSSGDGAIDSPAKGESSDRAAAADEDEAGPAEEPREPSKDAAGDEDGATQDAKREGAPVNESDSKRPVAGAAVGPLRIAELASMRSFRLACGAALLTAIGLALNPLLGIPGAESALILGVVLPPFAAALGASLVIATRTRGISGAHLLSAVLAASALPVALATLILALNGLRFSLCDPLQGFAFLLIGPLPSVLLAATLGALIALVLGDRERTAIAVAALLPIIADLVSASSLYTSPAVFVHGHFAGYFPGTLYDQDVSIGSTYLTFRALTLARIVGVSATLVAAFDPALGRLSITHARQRRVVMAVAASALLFASVGERYGEELGHRSSAAFIEESLGGRYEGEHCVAIVPREMPRAQAERLRDDCEFRIAQAEEALGVEQEARITAFFFRSSQEKRALMGAATTYVAKPWRNEVYLQVAGWPHPVLFHEIVHVVAGNTGRGPFRIAGRSGGWIPSPGIIEGIAVAIAWEERDGMTPHQWARAMLELDQAPTIAQTEGLGFLLQPASRAYTASGSFMRWIHETRGAEVVREIYRRGDYAGPLGMPLSEAEEQWRHFLLHDVRLPPEGRALAEARFERPAIFSQVCPHLVAALGEAAAIRLASGDEEGAAQTCREILEIDPGNAGTRARLAIALAQAGQLQEANEEVTRLVGPPAAARPVISFAQLGVADALWSRGDSRGARAIYDELRTEPMSEDEARQIDVRLLAISSGGHAEDALRELLAPAPSVTHDAATAMSAIARLREARRDGLADYLEARQLTFRERFDLALPLLLRSEELGLPSPRLEREAARMRAITLFALGRLEEAESDFRAVTNERNAADVVYRDDWLARIEWQRARGI